MTFDILIYGLGAIVAFIVLWQVVRYGSRLLTWIERAEIARQQAEAAQQRKSAAAAQAPVEDGDGIPAHHIAAIAAAAAAIGRQVVHIADGASGRAWASEGRWMHQTSHRPH